MESPPVINRFKSFYSELMSPEWAQLDDIYVENVRFRDPVHTIEGRAVLYRYLVDLCANVQTCRFEYLDEVIESNKAYIKWDMIFSHPRVNGGRTITVRGVSQIAFDEQGIFYHEDFYDMGVMLYENIPVMGSCIRWLKRRLAKVPA